MYVSSRQGQCLTYDAVSNVLSVVNGASVPQRGKAGGQMAHTNTYGTDTGEKFQLANVKDVMGDNSSTRSSSSGNGFGSFGSGSNSSSQDFNNLLDYIISNGFCLCYLCGKCIC